MALTRQWLLTQPSLFEANPLLLSMVKSEDRQSEGFDLALDRLDIAPRDEAWRYLFHKVKEEVASTPPPECGSWKSCRSPRTSASNCEQMRSSSQNTEVATASQQITIVAPLSMTVILSMMK